MASPLSIEVFAGNTQDPKTLAAQIDKVAKRFGGSEVTFVGDRGMIKTHQVEDSIGARISLYNRHHETADRISAYKRRDPNEPIRSGACRSCQ